MNVIIFSKDRAAQLDLLLRSMPKKIKEMVLYRVSDMIFDDGYYKIFNTIERPTYLWEEFKFKDDLLEIIDETDSLTVFLTDDDVFINPMPFGYGAPLLDANIACVSLRLNPHLPYCYTLNREQKIPKMNSANVWNWRLADADYGYPMSLDGHIFRTADILPLLQRLDYHDPNSLEAALARNPINRPNMICYDHSIILNNPINRVQDTVKNRHGNVSAEYLNEQFLAGRRIKLEPFIGYKNHACHEEIPIEWE